MFLLQLHHFERQPLVHPILSHISEHGFLQYPNTDVKIRSPKCPASIAMQDKSQGNKQQKGRARLWREPEFDSSYKDVLYVGARRI